MPSGSSTVVRRDQSFSRVDPSHARHHVHTQAFRFGVMTTEMDGVALAQVFQLERRGHHFGWSAVDINENANEVLLAAFSNSRLQNIVQDEQNREILEKTAVKITYDAKTDSLTVILKENVRVAESDEDKPGVVPRLRRRRQSDLD